ncbi:MAG: MFS transporter [Armatimonadota bacterium]
MFFTRFVPKATQYAYRWDARSAWLTGLYSGMTIPFFGVIARRDLHASPLAISLLISAPFIGHLLSMLVAWHMQSRPKKPYMFWLALIARGLMLFMAFANTTPLFVGLIILSQIVGCFTTPAYASMMKDAYPDDYRGRLMGLVRVGMTVAAMLAGLSIGQLLDKGLPFTWVMLLAIGAALVLAHEMQRNVHRLLIVGGIMLIAFFGAPYLAHAVSYRIIFPLAGILGALASWTFNHMPEAKTEESPERRFNVLEGLTTLFIDKRFALYSLAFFTFGFGNLLQTPLIPLFQVDELHITDQWVGILAMASSGTSALFYVIWGRLMDRYSPFLAVTLSFAIWGITPFVYANAHSVPTLMIASILVGIAAPGIDLTWLNAVMHFTNREGIPRYAALHTFLVGIRGLLAPFVGTWLLVHVLHGNLRQCFYVSAGVIWLGSLFMAVVALFVLRSPRHKHPAHALIAPATTE